MAERRGLLVDRPAQVQALDDSFGRQPEVLAHERDDLLFGKLSRSVRLDVDRDRIGDADGVRELNQRALGETGGDEVLGDVPGHVGRGAVDLRGVLARERAAAVGGAAAVGVDDDLAAGQARVALGSADDESAGRVDVELGVFGQEGRRE